MTKAEIRQHLADGVITARQAEILLLRLDFSQYVVAQALHTSRENVKSTERAALHKIARLSP